MSQIQGRTYANIFGYAAQCAAHGITLEKLEIETRGEINLRGFLGIDAAVPPVTTI